MVLDLLIKIASFIGVIGLLVTIHELGHFLVARLFGVRVLVFSIGFGKKICGFSRNGTEYVLSAIPLGGYVSMLDEDSSSPAEVNEADAGVSLNDVSLLAKSSILLAGPMANIFLAFFVYWLIFMIGVGGPKAFVGKVEVGSIAERSGLEDGDRIVSFGNNDVRTWEGFVHAFLDVVMDNDKALLRALTQDGQKKDLNVGLDGLSIDEAAEMGPFETLGFRPKKLEVPPKIKSVLEDSPAESGGLMAGDLVVALAGLPITSWSEFVAKVERNPRTEILVEIERQGKSFNKIIVPDSVLVGSKEVGKIGVLVDLSDIWSEERYSPRRAAYLAVKKTCQISVLTLKFIWKLVSLQASPKNLSGPIGIANYAGESAKIGFIELLKFIALVSVSLAIINLLPIPMLDGGHLLYYSVESIIGRALPLRLRQVGLQIGFFFLISLFLVATYNDVFRI